jgi:O-antigen/teichoic acid export membrane protein
MRRDILLLTGGRLAQALLAIASLRLLTALLSPAQVGSVYLMLSFTSWFGLFLINPVGMFINRKIHGWHQKKALLKRFRVFNLYVLAVSLLALQARRQRQPPQLRCCARGPSHPGKPIRPV